MATVLSSCSIFDSGGRESESQSPLLSQLLISVGGYRITVLLLYCQQYPAIVCDTHLGGRLSDYRTSVILSTIPCHCVWYSSRWAAIGLPYFCYTVNNTLPLCVILISVGGYRITVLLLYCQQYPAIVCDTHLGGRLSDYRTSVILSTIPCHCVWYSSRWAAIGLPYFCYTVNNTLPLCVILISVGGYRITVLLLYCQQYPAIVCDTYPRKTNNDKIWTS